MDTLRNYINSIRRDFANRPLDESSVPADPYYLFERWFDEAVGAQVLDPYAMIIATAGLDGQPTSRVVYLRDISKSGLVFYTNFESNKGKNLIENPKASALFFWGDLDRQIRVEGRVMKADDELSDAYFSKRPRESQIGAWASAQSSVLLSRAELEQKVEQLTCEFEGKDIPRPPFWGGFLLMPDSFEFWQGRPSRLHDRILFTKAGEAWQTLRLSP